MTENDAQKIIAEVERTYTSSQIRASLDTCIVRGKPKYKVKLLLVRNQRSYNLVYIKDWESLKTAWQACMDGDHYLPVQATEPTSKETRSYHLVDGQVMCISLRKDGYWCGHYRRSDGKYVKRFFGLVDPRERYQRVGQPERRRHLGAI
jgi:hypothetical protein